MLGGGAVTAVAETVAALLSERDGETANGRRVHVVLLVDSTDIRRSGEDVKALVEA